MVNLVESPKFGENGGTYCFYRKMLVFAKNFVEAERLFMQLFKKYISPIGSFIENAFRFYTHFLQFTAFINNFNVKDCICKLFPL